jgi:hypothetical protein
MKVLLVHDYATTDRRRPKSSCLAMRDELSTAPVHDDARRLACVAGREGRGRVHADFTIASGRLSSGARTLFHADGTNVAALRSLERASRDVPNTGRRFS